MKTYYVYAYLREDKNSPYYVGKGTGRRAFQPGGRNCSTPGDKSRITFLKENLLEEDALDLERKLILMFGRKCDGGLLMNKQEGGTQPPDWTGKKHTAETKAKLSKSHEGRTYSGRSWSQEEKNRQSESVRDSEAFMKRSFPVVLGGVSYRSQREAARALNCSPTKIRRLLAA